MNRYLLHLAVDFSMILPRERFSFIYEGRPFLFRSTFSNLYADSLLTIIDDNDASKSEALLKATDWANALAYSCHGCASISIGGGGPISPSDRLEQIMGLDQQIRTGPRDQRILGYDVTRIADIENDDQRRGLQVYNLARCSADIFNAFHIYWQVLEVRRVANNPSKWIDSLSDKVLKPLMANHYTLLLGGKTLGDYLYEDCRNQIAHLRRDRPGFTSLDFTSMIDIRRFRQCVQIIRELAEVYLRQVLKITGSRYLVAVPGQKLPEYLGNSETVKRYGRGKKLPAPTQRVVKAISRMHRGLDCGLKHKG